MVNKLRGANPDTLINAIKECEVCCTEMSIGRDIDKTLIHSKNFYLHSDGWIHGHTNTLSKAYSQIHPRRHYLGSAETKATCLRIKTNILIIFRTKQLVAKVSRSNSLRDPLALQNEYDVLARAKECSYLKAPEALALNHATSTILWLKYINHVTQTKAMKQCIAETVSSNLYLYLVIDVWSRKVVAWDVDEREDPAIAAELVIRACLRERISKVRKQPLILHADNGNAMRAATLESRLEELGVLRSFSRPRVSNDNPYSESLFRTVQYRPEYPRKPFASKDKACQWVASFVGW